MTKMVKMKELRAMYPYALDGHKKNCSCFCCGLKRDDLFQKDHPYEAQQMIETAKAKRQAIIDQHEYQKHKSSVKMEKVLTGNKYYKETDSMSYYEFVEYKIVEKPSRCFVHQTSPFQEKTCDCKTFMQKCKEVTNKADLVDYTTPDTVNCGECFQRMGNTAFGCPVCHSYNYVFGRMLKNPMDRRWTLPKYSGLKRYNPNHLSSAERTLGERTKTFSDKTQEDNK